jgi:hypothetical protein
VEATRAGNTRRDAARCAGVSASTLRAWLARGRQERRGRFPAFLAALKMAEAEAVTASVAVIRRAAEGGQLLRHTVTTRRDGSTVETKQYARAEWTAAAWWLERMHPGDWSLMREEIRRLAKEVKELTEKAGLR